MPRFRSIFWSFVRSFDAKRRRVYTRRTLSILLLCIVSIYLRSGSMALAQDVEAASTSFAVTTQDRDQTNPVVVRNEFIDVYLVVYEHDASPSNSDIDIYARRMNNNGSVASEPYALTLSSAQETRPDAAVNSLNGETLVVWDHITAPTTMILRRFVSTAPVHRVAHLASRQLHRRVSHIPLSRTTQRATNILSYGNSRR